MPGSDGPHQLLIDTHVLLWMLTAPDRLSTTIRPILSDRRTQLMVSAASALEIATKQRLGKLPQADALVRGYSRHLARLGVSTLAISSEHALHAGGLDWAHRDPFDRILAAQSMIEALPLVSADAAFASLNGIRVLW